MKLLDALVTVTEAARLAPENQPLRAALRCVDGKIERLRRKEERFHERQQRKAEAEEAARQWRIRAAQRLLRGAEFVRGRA